MTYKQIQLQAENDALVNLGLDTPKKYASDEALYSEAFADVYREAFEKTAGLLSGIRGLKNRLSLNS